MKKIETASIRRFLVQKMEDIRSSAHHTKNKLKNDVDKFADPLDMAVVEAVNGIELNCRGREWNMLLDIQETIMRIDRGLFGICDHCGRTISPKRLKFAPMSKLCISCQEQLESQRNNPKTKFRSSAGRIHCIHA